MILFIKGLIIGIGKIIPGVSGALLAMNFGVYERAISAMVNFFDNWKSNLRFLLLLGSGILLAIVLGSNGVIYLLNNYEFITMMFFLGLIGSGTYNLAVKIRCNYRDIGLIIGLIGLLLFFSSGKMNNEYIISNAFGDNIIFFVGGMIEVLASIIPGISGTAIQMIIGIYDYVLGMISKIFDINYVISNINLYLSYGLGMIVSFIGGTLLIDYLFKKYRDRTNVMILGFCIYSILMLGRITFSIRVGIIQIVIGIMLLIFGLLIGSILDK